MYKSETGFFLVISQPSSDSVSKYYSNFLLDLKSNLEIDLVTVIKICLIKSPKLFGKTRSMTVS